MAYVFYLAVVTWRDRSPSVAKAVLGNGGAPGLTFMPQFVEPGTALPLAQLLALSAACMAMTFGVFNIYGLVAHAFRRAVIESPEVHAWLGSVAIDERG